MKHTPGPWETRRFTEQGDTAIAQVGFMPHATVYPRGDGGTASPTEVATAHANAALIAAAPELLEALEYLMEVETELSDPEVIAKIIAAIAKAKGIS